MFVYWLIFASLTVAGSLIYNVCIKLGTLNSNAFMFIWVMSLFTTLTQTIIFLSAKYLFKTDMSAGLNAKGWTFAIAAGAGVAMIDICYFFAMRYGTPIRSQAFWTIGGMIALTIFSVLYFKEAMPPAKIAGIALGIVSLVLIIRA